MRILHSKSPTVQGVCEKEKCVCVCARASRFVCVFASLDRGVCVVVDENLSFSLWCSGNCPDMTELRLIQGCTFDPGMHARSTARWTLGMKMCPVDTGFRLMQDSA